MLPTTSILILVVISEGSERRGSAQMELRIPSQFLKYINVDKISLDIPGLVRVALDEYQHDTVGRIEGIK